jgi:lysophospholipase L1-like esterase
MDRRGAIGWMGLMLLGGCGGGGGGADGALVGSSSTPTTPAPAPAPAPGPGALASGAPISRNIAVWGDSLTWGYGFQLEQIAVGRSVFKGGVIGDTSTQAANRQVADTSHRDWVNVFWYGHNNQRDPVTIKADLARSVATLAPGNTHFLVLGVVNQADAEESRGSPVYNGIVQLNAELAALYPQNYFDMRAFMVSRYDPAKPQDVTDFQNDRPPASLRFDDIHLTVDGYMVVAQKVKELIDTRGW